MFPHQENEPFLNGLNGDVESKHDPPPRYMNSRWDMFKPRQSTFSTLISHLTVFTVTSLVWIGICVLVLLRFGSLNPSAHGHDTTGHLHHAEPKASFISGAREYVCGNSTAEAMAMGCKYDILTGGWLPTKCMDYESIEEYQSDGSWFGFADEARTKRLTIEEMSQLDFYYTSERDHIQHCANLWRKQFRAWTDGRKNIDTIIANKEHTFHCSQYMIDMTDRGPDLWNEPIKVFVDYGGCWSKE